MGKVCPGFGERHHNREKVEPEGLRRGANQTTLLGCSSVLRATSQQLLHPQENLLADQIFLPGIAAAHEQELTQGENNSISNWKKINLGL